MAATSERIVFIDTARFYAMALVFYGHFIERIMYLQNAAAAAHYKFVYSFHMVLFIILAGYISKQDLYSSSFPKYFKQKVITRLLPFLFFMLVFMIPPAFFQGEFFNLKLPSVEGYIGGLISTVFGIPMFCVPTWFILLIFSVEIVHFIFFRFFDTNLKLVIGILGFYIGGYYLNYYFDFFNPFKQKVVGYNYLFIHEALFLYAFYLLGIYLQKTKALNRINDRWVQLAAVMVCLTIVYFTYDLNKGPFTFFDAVVIFLSAHGHVLYFPLTAIVGSLMIIFLAKMTFRLKLTAWLGQHTLILIALNGIFYHYFNKPVAEWLVSNTDGSASVVLFAGVVMTIVSLVICIPLVFLLVRYVPQLVGKPKLNGPFIKNLL